MSLYSWAIAILGFFNIPSLLASLTVTLHPTIVIHFITHSCVLDSFLLVFCYYIITMKEALRYFKNAKELLNKSPIEDDRYEDVKYVQEACSTAYLAILKAIDEYLIGQGWRLKIRPNLWKVTEKC